MLPFLRRAAPIAAASLTLGSALPLAAQLPAWESGGPPLYQSNDVATAPDEATVYAASGDTAASQSAIYRSPDGGRTWQPLVAASGGEFFTEVLVDPRTPRRIYVASLAGQSVKVYRSSDTGTTWALTDTITPNCVPSLLAGSVPGNVLLSCGTRLRRSNDGAVTWHDLPAPFAEPTKLTAGPSGSILAYGATKIFRSGNDGDSWSPAGSAPSACPAVRALGADPAHPGVFVAGTGLIGGGGFQCGGVFRSEDSGASWTASTLDDVYATDLAIDPEDSSRVYVSAGYFAGGLFPPGGVFGSRDGGRTWESLRLPAQGALRLALSRSGRLLHAATSLGVFEHPIRKPRVAPPRP